MKIFDAHCDTLDLLTDKNSLYDCKTHYNLKKAGAYETHIQVLAICTDADIYDPKKRVSELSARFLKETGSINVIRTKADLEKAAGTNAILGVEGGEPVGEELSNVRALFDMGVRVLTLVWNHNNKLGGCAALVSSGLTPFGKAVVSEAERLGIMIDVSHLSEKGFYDVCETANKPFIASHSNSKAVCPHLRNLTDEQFKALTSCGGVAGINLYPVFLGENADVDTAVKHIEHFMSLGGEDSIGFGADFDGFDCLPRGINGAEDYGKIINRLLKMNYTEESVNKISYNNMARVFGEVLPDTSHQKEEREKNE